MRDVERALARGDVHELWKVWDLFNERSTWQRVLANATLVGNQDQVRVAEASSPSSLRSPPLRACGRADGWWIC